jgi:hypothetical protein
MQAKSDDLIHKNKLLRQKNKGMPQACLLSTYCEYPGSGLTCAPGLLQILRPG